MPKGILVAAWVFALSSWLAGCTGESKRPDAHRPAKQAAVFSSVSGQAYFRSARGGERWYPVSAGYSLRSGDSVSTGPTSRAEVQTRGPNTVIRVGASARFVLEQSDSAGERSLRVRVARGGVWGSAKILADSETFVLLGPAEALAAGPATFRMAVDGDRGAVVSVYDGEVLVRAPGEDPRKPEVHHLTRNEGLLLKPDSPPVQVRIPARDPWRRGWEEAAGEADLDSPPSTFPRIEEKAPPHPSLPAPGTQHPPANKPLPR